MTHNIYISSANVIKATSERLTEKTAMHISMNVHWVLITVQTMKFVIILEGLSTA